MKKIILAAIIFFSSCKSEQSGDKSISVTNSDGIYRLIRPEGKPNALGAKDVEIWAKDGVSTNDFVYLKSVWSDGSFKFTRVLP